MKQSLSSWDGRWRSPSFWIATGMGSGLMRPAPGTWGSLAALVIGYGAYSLGISFGSFLFITAIATVLGSYVIDQIEQQCGVHDAPEIVVDEFAGMWIALMPVFYMAKPEVVFIAAFILFRIFDIWKPYPIGWVDRKITGGFGVMADDLIAGVYAVLCIEGFFFAFA